MFSAVPCMTEILFEQAGLALPGFFLWPNVSVLGQRNELKLIKK